MASMTYLDKQQLESLFDMSSGYVMKFSDRTFGDFFNDTVGIQIFDPKYAKASGSKANRLRAFWEIESDALVGRVLAEMLKVWLFEQGGQRTEKFLACERIALRLQGRESNEPVEEDFLSRRIEIPPLDRLPVEPCAIPILESRLREAEKAHQQGLGLATVILCGSILEGALLGLAQKNIREFNQSPCAPNDRETGKVKRLWEWSLAEHIDVAHERGHLPLDVKKFSHALRDFRNFIHPYEQMRTGFQPDSHTAAIGLQVLRAAIASLTGERKATT